MSIETDAARTPGGLAFPAAVAAAIAAYTGRDIKGFRITRITKI